MKITFESCASMFHAQTLPTLRSKGPNKSIFNLALVIGWVASFPYKGMLAEVTSTLRTLRNTSGGEGSIGWGEVSRGQY